MLYLDNAGAAVPTKELIEECYFEFINNTYGNPHSDPKTYEIIEKTRKEVIRFIGLNEYEYTLIFTSGATEAIKFIGYNFQVKKFSYTRCNHNSVTGLRNLIKEINVLDDDFNIINSCGEEGKEGINLVAYPLESNFSGKLFPLEKVNELQNENTFVLLDCAKYLTCRKLDDTCKPDFIPVSFYKLFGMPTGLGALCINKRALPFLKKEYYGGGTYSIIDPLQKDVFVPREFPQNSEDGTGNYQGIISLSIALKLNEDYYIKNKAVEITKYAFKELKKLRHYNNTPLLQIYGVDDINNHGSIIAFNLMDQNGEYIGFKDVEKLCEQKGIKIRSGCFCNPGACNFYLNLTSEEVMENYKRGNKCWDTKTTSLNGKPTGAIRISFGSNSTLNDLNLFVKFLQDNYVIKAHENISFDNSNKPRITALYIYPIKGALGLRVNNWSINKQGLKWDRHFAVYDNKDKSISLKSNVKLGLIRPEIHLEDGFMTLVNEETNDSISFYIRRFNTVQDSVNDWISNTLGEEGCKLVECGDEKNFSNTSQYLLLNMNSLYDLNYRILLNTQPFLQWFPDSVKKLVCSNYIRFGYGIGIERFRPNIVVEGLPAYEEDNINEFTIGDIVLKNDMGCVRCYTTTVNSRRQQQDENLEPMRTLLKYRKKDGKVLFGTLFNMREANDRDYLKEGEITFVNK